MGCAALQHPPASLLLSSLSHSFPSFQLTATAEEQLWTFHLSQQLEAGPFTNPVRVLDLALAPGGSGRGSRTQLAAVLTADSISKSPVRQAVVVSQEVLLMLDSLVVHLEGQTVGAFLAKREPTRTLSTLTYTNRTFLLFFPPF